MKRKKKITEEKGYVPPFGLIDKVCHLIKLVNSY